MGRSLFMFAAACFVFAAVPVFALGLGDAAPSGVLQTYDGKTLSLSDYKGKIVVLEWFNPGCPFVKKHYHSGAMQALQKEYTAKGVVWLTVNSTNPNHPNYVAPADGAKMISEFGISSSAVVLDDTGALGKDVGAKTTPHIFIFDRDGKLAYRGAIDDQEDTSSDPHTAANNYLRLATNALLEAKPVLVPETISYGCSVKY